MKPSSRKSTLSVEQMVQLCEDYYEHEIFNPKAELEVTLLGELGRCDFSSAMAIDTDIFQRELAALNIELFGLAWLNYNYKLYEEEKQDQNQADLALSIEILFAKSYLEKAKSSDIWSAAGFYNQTILEAAIAQGNSIAWSAPRDMEYYERAVLSSPPVPDYFVKFTTEITREHFDKFLRDHLDEVLKLLKHRVSDTECSLRLSNRLASIHSWRDGIMIPQKLSSAFAERLSFIPNSEALLLLQRLVVGLYKNARDFTRAVIDYGSWEAAKRTTIALRQAIIRAARKPSEEKQKGSGDNVSTSS